MLLRVDHKELFPPQGVHTELFPTEGVNTWWRHQMETFSALLALCEGNSPVTGEFPSQSMDRLLHLL